MSEKYLKDKEYVYLIDDMIYKDAKQILFENWEQVYEIIKGLSGDT